MMASQQPPPTLPLPPTSVLGAWPMSGAVLSGTLTVPDISGRGKHATMSTAAWQAAISSDGGHASLLFDGSNDHLVLGNIAASSGIKTFYASCNPIGTSGPRTLFGNQLPAFTGCGATSGKYSANDTAWRESLVNYATGKQRIAYEMSSTGWRLFINGAHVGSTAYTVNPTFSGNGVLGAAFAGGTWAWGGHLFGAYLYGAAHDVAVENYMIQEHGA